LKFVIGLWQSHPMALPSTNFHSRTPVLLVVDDFYRFPDEVRNDALGAEYEADGRYFKGVRSKKKFLYPYVKEEFERVLRVTISDWLDQPANGSFQKTTNLDPLVWHSDTQSYAAAVYLTEKLGTLPDGRPCDPVLSGTSFWRNKTTGARRPPSGSADYQETYSQYNLTHPDNWDLVDRVGNVYNRLVLWDAQLIHSATSYDGYPESHPRLVQLFFFNVAR
jgi:hypothetical protein